MINIYIAKVLHTWNAHYCILSIIINFRPWNAPSSLFCVQAPPPIPLLQGTSALFNEFNIKHLFHFF